jgi:hypothetical protein
VQSLINDNIMLKAYLKKIADTANRGDAREESYYPVLKELLDEYGMSVGKKEMQVTVLPKKTEAGNPDFRVWDGKQHITGYVEAKDPANDNLDRIEDSEQLKRYRHTFPNLILTNFLEFRLYRNGALTDKVLVGRPFIVHKLKTPPPVEKEPELLQLFEKFFSFALPKVYDARNLAIELAKRTRFLKDEVISQELREEEQNGKGFILGFYEAFRKFLIQGITKEDFADLYSQTIAYGLFAARTRAENGFSRRLAFDYIPRTIGILRDVFRFVSLEDLPPQMEWIVDDIAEVLAVADTKQILHKFYREGKGSDPIIHFYETFLAQYDPKERERRGVYYTPEPVVSYIVRSVDAVLRDSFGKADGFASQTVTVLDPAAGTLTFLAEASKLAVEEFASKYGQGGTKDFIKNHILKNFYAFELMMAPYAVGHLKMSFLLEELGYQLQKDERFKLYLTNTLEMEELAQTTLPGMASLSEESHLAGQVKKEKPILAILGNPPYSGHSTNIGDWITREIKTYHLVDGKPLGEKNPKWLQDDYVKFIRFAQWKIEQAGEGVLGFITNHGYLDNPTFRGMRRSLMESFDEIYLLDLHGNSLKKERCPDGSKDENVFDIQQGVAIALFIKKKGLKKIISHAEIWGLREKKYDWLNSNNMTTTKWKKITPKSEFYLFIPRNEELLKQYESYRKITDIFPVNSVGIVTSRDEFVTDFDKEKLLRRIRQFRDLKLPDEIIRQTYNLNDKASWKLKEVRESVAKDDNWEQAITKILYRPFDERWIFYHDTLVERARKEVMQHMMVNNLSLCFMRQVSLGDDYSHALVSSHIVDNRTFLSSKGITQQAPLYVYTDTDEPKRKKPFGCSVMLFEPSAAYVVKRPNINETLLSELSAAYKKPPSPEEIFHYIYAVLYSSIYRTRYAEFLKIDFPRIPFTKDIKLFRKMAGYGKRLVDLHLLKSPELNTPAARFQGTGDNRVEKLSYDEKESLLYINKAQYFEGISVEAWNYRIGGYQVCDKWLKDRKERPLFLDEMKTYCRMVTAIQKTMEIQKFIDKIYEEVENNNLS